LVVVGVLLAAGPARAQTAALNLSPSTVKVGGRVNVTGTCDPDASGYVITEAFLGHGEFAGVPAATFSTDSAGNFAFSVTINRNVLPGTYPVGARCAGANIGLTRTLTVTAAALVTTGSEPSRLLVPGLVLVVLGVGFLGVAGLATLGRRRAEG